MLCNLCYVKKITLDEENVARRKSRTNIGKSHAHLMSRDLFMNTYEMDI